MYRLRLLYLGYRYVPMRPDSFLAISAMLIIIGVGAVSMYMGSEKSTMLTLGAGMAAMGLQVTAIWQIPGFAAGLTWSGLIIEQLKSSRSVLPGSGKGAARRRMVRHLHENGNVP